MLIAKYLLSNVCRQAPELEGAPAEPPPTVTTPPSAVLGAEPPAPEPAPEPPAGEPEPAPEPAPHGNKGGTPWFTKRISELSHRASSAEERARIAEEALQRAQQGATPPSDPAAARTTQQQPQNFETAVRSEAERLRLYEDTVAVKNAGLAVYPDFNNSLNLLTAVGATEDDFVKDVLAVDRANAHAIFHKLAQDPEKAAALAGMSSRARIAELTRMTMPAAAAPAVEPAKPAPKAAAAPAPKQVSKAPPPAPPVEPSAVKVVDWRADGSSEEDFQRGWEESMRQRNTARR